MQIWHTEYWSKKKEFRPDISDDFIEYAIQHSDTLNDRNWEGLFNAIARIPATKEIMKKSMNYISKVGRI